MEWTFGPMKTHTPRLVLFLLPVMFLAQGGPAMLRLLLPRGSTHSTRLGQRKTAYIIVRLQVQMSVRINRKS